MKRSRNSVKSKDENEEKSDEDGAFLKQVIVKGKAPVDSLCTTKAGVAHVYYEGNDVYDVMLNQTNVQHNNNKYYIIQLLEDDAKKAFSVWFRWGRVGKTGQNTLEAHGSNLNSAKASFKKKFYDKTLNDWDLRSNFVKVEGKYGLVQLDYAVEEVNEPPNKKKKAKPKPSKLPEAVQLLMKLICDIRSMEATMKELQYDARRAPLGKLTKQQVKAGYLALAKVTSCINKLAELISSQANETAVEKPSVAGTKKSRFRRNSSVTVSVTEKKRLNALLLEACNEFYTRIPHDFGMRVPPILRTVEEIKQKHELLEALDDIEYAVRILKKDEGMSNENLLDVHYRQLGCDIVHLTSSDMVYQTLLDYVEMNHGPSHSLYRIKLLDLFECRRHQEADHFRDLGNRMLLWHGSRLSNWVGILGRGLRIAPPEAPSTGLMFGKGIYFADCVSKSANYAYPTELNNVGLVALCEVSLGHPNELYQANYTAHELPEDCHSVKGVGSLQPDRTTWKTLPNGIVVPSGKLQTPEGLDPAACALQYNEFVVYDTCQVLLRYIAKVQFDFV